MVSGKEVPVERGRRGRGREGVGRCACDVSTNTLVCVKEHLPPSSPSDHSLPSPPLPSTPLPSPQNHYMDMEKMIKALERRVRTIEVHKDKVRGTWL